MRFPRYFVFVFACKHRGSFAWTPVLLSLEPTFSLVKARRKIVTMGGLTSSVSSVNKPGNNNTMIIR